MMMMPRCVARIHHLSIIAGVMVRHEGIVDHELRFAHRWMDMFWKNMIRHLTMFIIVDLE
jgi:hypothetical protein